MHRYKESYEEFGAARTPYVRGDCYHLTDVLSDDGDKEGHVGCDTNAQIIEKKPGQSSGMKWKEDERGLTLRNRERVE